METTQRNSSEVQPVIAVATTLPTVGTLWRASWSFVGANFWRVVLASLLCVLVNVPGMVASFVLMAMVEAEQDWNVLMAVSTVATVLSIAGSALSIALMTVVTISGRSISIGETFGHAMRLFWPLTLAMFIMSGVVMTGLVFLIVPGLILSILLVPVMWIVAVEGLTPKAALIRSIQLVAERWWSVCAKVIVLLLFVILAMIVAMIGIAILVPLFILLGSVSMVGAVVLGTLAVVVLYITFVSTLSFFMTRYSYELYLGLVATVSPTRRSWWQGLPLTVFIPVGCVICTLYLIATPYLTVVDMQQAQEEIESPIEEADFDVWLEENPEFREKFNNLTPQELN